MKQLIKRIELIANISVIVAVVVFVCSAGWLLRHRSSIPVRHSSIEKGTRVTLAGQDWTTGQQTLVLVLSTDCKYCTASASFYRSLVGEAASTHRTRFVAVLPQPPNESREYLAKLEIQFDDLKQAVPLSLGSKGTPTLILVNSSGVVIQSWEGQLPTNAENEVRAFVK